MKTQAFTRQLSTYAGASTSYFIDPIVMSRSRTTNEARAQFKFPVSGVIRNLRAYVTSNARVTSSTARLRINGVNGLAAIAIAGGATGDLIDAVNSDVITAGDLVCINLQTGTGSQVLSISHFQFEFEADDGTTRYFYCYTGLDSLADFVNLTRWSPICGFGRSSINGWRGTNVIQSRTYMSAAAVISNARVLVVSNAQDGTATFELYKNGVATGMLLSIPPGTTGEFIDAVNTVTVAPDDYVQWHYSSTRTVGGIAIAHLELSFQDTGDEQWQTTVISTEDANPLISAPADRYSYASGGSMSYSATSLASGFKLMEDTQVVHMGVAFGGNYTTGSVVLRVNAVDVSMNVVSGGAGSYGSSTAPEGLFAGDVMTIHQFLTTGSNSNLAHHVTFGFGPPVADVVASGDVGTVTLVPAEGDVDTSTEASGAIGTVTLVAPEGGAISDDVGAGPIGTVTLTPPRVTIARATQAGINVAAIAENKLNTTQAGLGAVAEVEAVARITQMGLLVIAKGGETPLVPDPLKLQDGGREQLLVQRLVNMYVETTPEGPVATARFQRPGLYVVAERGGGPVRASFLHKGFRYTVSGDTVWRDSENIGFVPADGELRWAVSDEEIVVVAGNRAYYVTTTEVVRIADPDLPFIRDVIVAAGRFVYIVADESGMYYYSDVNDAKSIAGLSFASAEANPDAIMGAATMGEAIGFFGRVTTEWHYPTLDPNNPFQRSQGRTYDKGCLAIQTIRLADNALHFQGNDRIVYRAAATPTRVSTHSVEDRLRKQTEEEFAQNSAFSIVFGGHTFYVLNIVGQGTWALNVGQKLWAEWKSWGMDRFRVSTCEEGFMGDAVSGRIMGFDGKQYTDFDDAPIERIISTFQPLKNGFLRNFSLALHCQQGVGTLPGTRGETPVVEMRFSDHLGQDWSPWLEAPLGVHGQRGKEALALWTNLGTFPSPGRAFEFRCSDPVSFTPYMVSFNEWRP